MIFSIFPLKKSGFWQKKDFKDFGLNFIKIFQLKSKKYAFLFHKIILKNYFLKIKLAFYR